MKTELEILEEKVSRLKALQSRCNHKWSKPEFDPESREIIEEIEEREGAHTVLVPYFTGRYQNVDRWSRVCTKCGKKEYTYEMETVSVKTKPKFK